MRLVLRKPAEGDAATLWEAYTADPAISRYMTWRPHGSVEETQEFVDKVMQDWERRQGYAYVVELSDAPGRPIGMVQLRPQGLAASLGYVVSRRDQGRGLATEAAGCLCEWALRQEQIYRVWAYCDPDNLASARVLTKVGMAFEGTMRRHALRPNLSSEPRDSQLYARTR